MWGGGYNSSRLTLRSCKIGLFHISHLFMSSNYLVLMVSFISCKLLGSYQKRAVSTKLYKCWEFNGEFGFVFFIPAIEDK